MNVISIQAPGLKQVKKGLREDCSKVYCVICAVGCTDSKVMRLKFENVILACNAMWGNICNYDKLRYDPNAFVVS